MNIMLCHLRYDHDDLLFVFSTFHLLDFLSFWLFLFLSCCLFYFFTFCLFKGHCCPHFQRAFCHHTFSIIHFQQRAFLPSYIFKEHCCHHSPQNHLNLHSPASASVVVWKLKCCLQKSVWIMVIIVMIEIMVILVKMVMILVIVLSFSVLWTWWFFSFVNLMVFQLCELDGLHVSQTNRLRLRCLRSCHCKSTIDIVSFLDAIASPSSYPCQWVGQW